MTDTTTGVYYKKNYLKMKHFSYLRDITSEKLFKELTNVHRRRI